MKEQIPAIETEALARIAGAHDERALEEVRVAVLGKKGTLTLAAAGMKDVPKEDKAAVGQLLNAARTAITTALEEKQAGLQDAADQAALAGIETFRTIRKGQFESCRTGVENEIDFVAKLFPEAA